MKRTCLSVITAAIWINAFEFARNEFLLKKYWVNHFESKGLVFQTLPINGILWTVWGILLAYIIFKLSQKFSLCETVCIAWISSFVMMWITTYNLQVFPLAILVFAIPLSLFEVWLAAYIIDKMKEKQVSTLVVPKP